jgi:predicted nucleotide-binding protein (sugar kinase/HSP70/actin superfamily)
MLIPAMGSLAPQALASVFRGFGINSEVLPLSNVETLKCGRQNTNCKECLPLILIVGGLLNYLKNNPDSSGPLVYFLPTGTGNCRFGQYKVFLKNLIEKKKPKNLALFSLRNEDSYSGFGFNLRRKALEALVISDVMLDIKNTLRALAKDRDMAEEVFKKEWFKMMGYLEGKQNLSLKKRLKQTALALKEIPLKMPLSCAKKILLTGEIYVRHEDFVTDF